MQTAKTRNSTAATATATTEAPPQRTSPSKMKAARQLKISGPDSDGGVPSPNQASKKPKEGSPRIIERKSPRAPPAVLATEKKRLTKVSELESQLSQIQDELKKAKDQLNSSESTKKQAQQEAEDAQKQLSESQKQLMDLSTSEEARLQELRKISQERDQAWQSELEAVQKQHSMDSAALNSSLNEIQKLKFQLEKVSESEVSHARHAESAHADIQNLRHELTETLALVEKLKTQITNFNESEDQALELLNRTQMQLEIAKTTEETLRSESDQTVEALKALTLEFDQSKARANSLEELVTKLQADIPKEDNEEKEEAGDANQLKTELNETKTEINQLRTALDAAERRYQEEYIKSTLQIRSAYELIERTKSESSMREAELEEKLKKARTELEELRDDDKPMKKEENIEQNPISERESNMERELKKLGLDIEDLKASLMDKETELQSIMEENETLKREIDETKANNEATSLAEAAKAAERDGLMIKVGSLAEEADKSNRKAARTCEQLEATQVANLELEAELRKLKVQSDQWRKAAEAAAAMISSTGNNGRFVERTGSLNSTYNNNSIGGGKKMIGSPNYEEEMEDESPKKKNGNMLKKIGVLLKKGSQK